MILIINNSIIPHFIAIIKRKRIIYSYFQRSQKNILFQLEFFLKKYKIKLKEISGLITILSHHSFTNIRIMVTILNIFSVFFNIPISQVMISEGEEINDLIKIGKKRLKKQIIIPLYFKEPNITR